MSDLALTSIQKPVYTKSKKVDLNSYYDENWLKDRMVEDTSILNLGELEVIDREHVQSSGGRIDLLLYDRDLDIYYEVEVMLGKTDESHIMRTIEYWDIENRKSPSKEHVAVIIAEDITNRFFNIIYLINRSIPIIAIQLDAILVDNNHLVLNFTKVLDLHEEIEPEPKSRLVDEKEWQRRVDLKQVNSGSFKMAMDILNNIKNNSNDENIVTSYKNEFIALSKDSRYIIALYPRKTKERVSIDMRFDNGDKEEIKTGLDELDLEYNFKRDDLVTIFLDDSDYRKNKDKLDKLFMKSKNF